MKVSEITLQNLADYLRLDYSSLDESELLQLTAFLDAANAFVQSYTGLTAIEIDTHPDFVIAIYVLVQDMYDNRSYYIDKSNLNHVVETILGMHSVNLL